MPIPDHLDMYHLHQEAEPSEMNALEAVVDHVKKEMERLHAQVISCCIYGGGGVQGDFFVVWVAAGDSVRS